MRMNMLYAEQRKDVGDKICTLYVGMDDDKSSRAALIRTAGGEEDR